LACWSLWLRSRRSPQEDARLSRGLQLLTSKIAILEDLSDRTDKQVHQLTDLLEQRSRLLQTKIFEAEKLVRELEQSMHKSREVAEIFQDKIPHEEIIERQNTIKYVKAAQLAHRGIDLNQIAAQVDLPREQIEFIAKVNRTQLMFDVDQLPEWAKQHVISECSPE
jgi:mannose/fructose/N-acetylgalactosamine-specific phosphotransferase system component IIB